MKLDIKTIIGFVVIAVVAYLCRPINDKIANVFIEEKNDKDMEMSIEEEIGELKISGNIDGHDYVDLGLSVKWATCNVGATSQESEGSYFVEKENNESTMTAIHKSYLTATTQWGESWRIPTKEEWNELKYECTWKWTAINGNKGYKITANNGNWIFLPHTSMIRNMNSDDMRCCGIYWSSTVNESKHNCVYYLFFDSDSRHMLCDRCYPSLCVRPVTE